MKDLKITSLYSGSGGNATLVRSAGATVLIDAGKSLRTLSSALKSAGCDVGKLDAIFVTHEHSDHTAALAVLSKKHPIPIHMTEPTVEGLARSGVVLRYAVKHPLLFEVKVGDLTVRSFELSHDSDACVGYRIDTDGGESFGSATDTGYVTDGMLDKLSGCRTVIIESNYDEDMLKFGPYPHELKRRISSRSGHLSNTDCAVVASQLAVRGTRHFMLAHLSRENNSPELALSTVKKALAQFPDVRVSVADPEHSVSLTDSADEL